MRSVIASSAALVRYAADVPPLFVIALAMVEIADTSPLAEAVDTPRWRNDQTNPAASNRMKAPPAIFTHDDANIRARARRCSARVSTGALDPSSVSVDFAPGNNSLIEPPPHGLAARLSPQTARR